MVAGAALFAASVPSASATFVPSSMSSSPLLSASSASSVSSALDSASRALANATSHKIELLVASLGKLSPPWLTEIANEAGRRAHGLKKAEEAKASAALGKRSASSSNNDLSRGAPLRLAAPGRLARRGPLSRRTFPVHPNQALHAVGGEAGEGVDDRGRGQAPGPGAPGAADADGSLERGLRPGR